MNGALGNTTDFASPPEPESEQGISRYAMLETAGALLGGRQTACYKMISHKASQVEIISNGTGSWLRGTVVCGNGWTCPVCASRIAKGRQSEVQKLIDAATDQGQGMSFITFTFSHTKRDSIEDLSSKQRLAIRYMKSGKGWQTLQKRWGLVGAIRNLEVTHGENGWHPHTHELTVHNRILSDDDREKLESDLFARWAKACAKHGLGTPNRDNGVKVEGFSAVAEYMTKWGAAAELTWWHIKRGKNGSVSPFDLLALATQGDKRAAALYCEYARAFKGLAQLVWSKGLRALFDITPDTRSDKELSELEPANDDAPEPVTVKILSRTAWRMVCKFKARGRILDAALFGCEAVDAVLIELIRRIKISVGHTKWDGRFTSKQISDWLDKSEGQYFRK